MPVQSPAPALPLDTPQAAYTAAVEAMRKIGTSLGCAVEIRYETPPGFRAVPNRDGVLDPTLDLVTDPRRVELGRVISASQLELARSACALRVLSEDLDRAVTAWGGGA